jgi:phage baseplate assembly protein W
MANEFIGAGWSFPLRIDSTGAFALETDTRDIEQAIKLILFTSPGERPMRPNFGCRIHDRVFSLTNEATAAALANDVRAALEQWEPRIELTDVLVNFDQTAAGTFFIDIGYRIRSDNSERNLVFPFYVIPDEPKAIPNHQTSTNPLLNRA